MKGFLLALTGIVAVGAITLGIRDYIHQKNTKPAAGASTPAIVQSNAITASKKNNSAKTKPARVGSGANSSATAEALADDTEKALISKEFSGTESAQATHDEVEAAMDRNNRPRKAARPETGLPHCMPLPNGTRPEDVDARYYKDWAKEYSCQLP